MIWGRLREGLKPHVACTRLRTSSCSLQLRHNERGGVSNHRRLLCLLNRLYRRRSNKTSKLRFTCFNEGTSPVTCEFPAQMASKVENVSICWRYHVPTGTLQIRGTKQRHYQYWSRGLIPGLRYFETQIFRRSQICASQPSSILLLDPLCCNLYRVKAIWGE